MIRFLALANAVNEENSSLRKVLVQFLQYFLKHEKAKSIPEYWQTQT